MTPESPSQGCLALVAGKKSPSLGNFPPFRSHCSPAYLRFLFTSALPAGSIERTRLAQSVLHPPDPEKQGPRLGALKGEMIWLKDGGQWGPQRGVLGRRIMLQTWAEPPNAAMRV